MAFKIEFHPDAAGDFAALDGSIQKEIAKKIDALSSNPFLGKPLGNKMGMDLTGFFKLYAVRKKYRIVYRLSQERLEIVEIIGIGKREKAEIYKLIFKRLQDENHPQ
ncbi:ParE2: predicted plasmid stabilization system protein [Desulfosarcina variabilis str. Montpellier]|uniref:type II toxin-antitoxin system RelE family toxin n=1 Tax=Desulfosarcina variabilis TaxID=2300 RepID=UPI003AFA7F86